MLYKGKLTPQNGEWLIFVTRMWTLMVAALRSHKSNTPLCIGKIETPDRNTLLVGDDACANNAGPAVVTPSIVLVDRTRCPFTVTASTVLLSCVQDLKMWQNVSSSICSARFLKATLMCQGIPHVGYGVLYRHRNDPHHRNDPRHRNDP